MVVSFREGTGTSGSCSWGKVAAAIGLVVGENTVCAGGARWTWALILRGWCGGSIPPASTAVHFGWVSFSRSLVDGAGGTGEFLGSALGGILRGSEKWTLLVCAFGSLGFAADGVVVGVNQSQHISFGKSVFVNTLNRGFECSMWFHAVVSAVGRPCGWLAKCVRVR